MVQKPPSEVAATADEEGGLNWASASGAVRVEVGALKGKMEGARNHLRVGRWEQREGRGDEKMGGGDGLTEGTGEHQRSRQGLLGDDRKPDSARGQE